MRVHPVVVEDLREGEAVVRGDEGHHLARVLRVRPGDGVRAFDGRGREASGVVRAVERDRVTLELDGPAPSGVEPDLEVTMAVALLKGDKLADVVRMGTELGVARFVLVQTRRAEPDVLSRSKAQRLERIAREAAKQSGRAVIPTIEGPTTLDDLPVDAGAIVADPGADTSAVSHVQATLEPSKRWLTLTGPEGGFADEEVGRLVGRGAARVRLGRSILRAETAAVVLAAAVLLAAP